jgi:hypothetical protein
MKKLALAAACLIITMSSNAQTFVKIGDLEFALKSPITISKDTNSKEQCFNHEKGYKTMFDEFYLGFGLSVNTTEEQYLPVYYGNSYNLEFGWKYMYRPSKNYAIGTLLHYTSNTFKLTPEAIDGEFFQEVGGEPYKMYFRTDNIGTGIINRFYLYSGHKAKPVYIEFGGYADYLFSKRYKVKTVIDGDKEKYKFRDGSKFNPFEAGLQGGIGLRGIQIYAKYRMTDYFSSNYAIPEVPRWTLGVQFTM